MVKRELGHFSSFPDPVTDFILFDLYYINVSLPQFPHLKEKKKRENKNIHLPL